MNNSSLTSNFFSVATNAALLGGCVATLLVACAGSQRLAKSDGGEVVQLAPAMQSLQFYVGNWACTGIEYDANGKASSPIALEVNVAPKLGGTWLAIEVLEKSIRVTTELKGVDPRDQSFHHIWATPDGQWGSLTSAGWHEADLEFMQDKPPAKNLPYSATTPAPPLERMTFTKIDDTNYRHQAEEFVDDQWRLTFKKVCVKRK